MEDGTVSDAWNRTARLTPKIATRIRALDAGNVRNAGFKMFAANASALTPVYHCLNANAANRVMITKRGIVHISTEMTSWEIGNTAMTQSPRNTPRTGSEEYGSTMVITRSATLTSTTKLEEGIPIGKKSWRRNRTLGSISGVSGQNIGGSTDLTSSGTVQGNTGRTGVCFHPNTDQPNLQQWIMINSCLTFCRK